MKTLTLLFTLLLAQFAGAQNKYTTFEVGPGARLGNVQAINDSGQVLGWWPANGEAYVLSPGGIWTKNIIKTTGGPLLFNNAATIAGQESPGNYSFYKVWEQPPQGLVDCSDQRGNEIGAGAINQAGDVAGLCVIYGEPVKVFLENPLNNTLPTTITFPHDKWPNSWVNIAPVLALNNLDQIVGGWSNYSTPYSGFFYDSKSKNLTLDFNMPNAVTTYPVSINDNQEVVGNWYDQNNVEHGFYWNPNAGFSDIDVAGDTAMNLIGINNQSVILGAWIDDNTPMLQHFVTIVNGQVTASIRVPGSQAGRTFGVGINNVGQVVGEYQTQAGIWRGFIYTPPK
jgi:hypothetical protein